MTHKNPVEELLAESMAQLQTAQTFAKAAQSGAPAAGPSSAAPDDDSDNLDDDFDDLHAAQRGADDADGEEDDEDPEKEGDGDSDGDQQGQFSKADGDGDFVDALPLFEELDGRLESMQQMVTDLTQQVSTLAKAVQSQVTGTTMLAKAIAPALDQPLAPKTRRAVVPTMQTMPQANPAELMAKAEQAVANKEMGVADLTLLSGCISAMGMEGARRELPRIFSFLESK